MHRQKLRWKSIVCTSICKSKDVKIPMNMSQLKCFECVYECQSINKAAKLLFMSPQGVGRTVQSLESELDVVLFERTCNGVFPTECGELMHKKASIIIQQVDELKKSLAQLCKKNEMLRIGYVTGTFNVIPFDAIMRFKRENPGICVTWNEYSNPVVRNMLLNHELEYGFGIGIKAGEDVIYHKLERKKALLYVYEGHPFYNVESVNVGMLSKEQILILNEDYWIFYRYRELCREYGFSMNVVAKSGDSSALLAMCSQRVGVAILPEYMCEHIYTEGIRAIPLEDDFELVVHGVYKRDNANIETIRRFDEYISQIYIE